MTEDLRFIQILLLIGAVVLTTIGYFRSTDSIIGIGAFLLGSSIGIQGSKYLAIFFTKRKR